MSFVHLHLHSEYSLLDGAIKIKNLFDRVKELGMTSVAITEHGNMNAIIKKYQIAKDKGIKLIFGMEAYLVKDITVKEKKEKKNHLILLAKDNEGYKNLIKLTSIANTDGFYYKPSLDKKTLREYSKGLICLSACLKNDLAESVIKGNLELSRNLIKDYIDIFGKDNFYLEAQNHGIPEEAVLREMYPKLAEEFSLKIVATTDAHYLNKDDAQAHATMLCIQTNSTFKDPNRFKFNGTNYHITSEEEMKELFKEHPEWVENTVEVADKCNVSLEIGETIFPIYELPSEKTEEEYLEELCRIGFEERYAGKSNYEIAKERMMFELSVINKMKFATYFLIVQDFIRDAKKKCQVGPGRGSGAGSIVAYCLGITQLDPLDFGLLFERFLNPERISLPDFDVDFGDKDLVINYVKEKYGHDKIALIGTFGTMSAKSVIKDVARAYDVPFSVSNEITNFVNEKTIKESLELKDENGSLKNIELINYQKQYPEVFEIAQKLEGCVRHKGIHACGVVWGKKAIDEYIPIYEKDGFIVTQIDGPEIENFGLVKFDFLGLETLNITKKVLDTIGKDDKWLESIPLDDSDVYKMLREGRTIGIFQLESGGMRKTLSSVKPTNFEDIIAIVALYRPGSMDFIETYGARKSGKEKFEYIHQKTEPILKATFGILIYQEQVMQLSRSLANFTMGEADVLRKAIGKKKLDLMKKMEDKFKKGCIEHSGLKEKVVNDLWDNIVKFASYSFNKSHAAAYALISYRTAFLKHYYPVEFAAASISANMKDIDKMGFYVQAAKKEKIEVLLPDINLSEREFSVEEFDGKKKIRFGLSGIRNLGDEAIHEILTKRPFKSYQDFINKVNLSKINKRVLHNLVSVGAFESINPNRASLLQVYDKIDKEDSNLQKQKTLFGQGIKTISYPDIPELNLKQKLDLEKEYLGLYMSGDLLDLYNESKMKHFREYNTMSDDLDVSLLGLIKKYNIVHTKTGEQMAFLNISFKNEDCEVVAFPKVFHEMNLKYLLKEDIGIIVEGKFKENDKEGIVVANNINFLKIKKEYMEQ